MHLRFDRGKSRIVDDQREHQPGALEHLAERFPAELPRPFRIAFAQEFLRVSPGQLAGGIDLGERNIQILDPVGETVLQRLVVENDAKYLIWLQ